MLEPCKGNFINTNGMIAAVKLLQQTVKSQSQSHVNVLCTTLLINASSGVLFNNNEKHATFTLATSSRLRFTFQLLQTQITQFQTLRPPSHLRGNPDAEAPTLRALPNPFCRRRRRLCNQFPQLRQRRQDTE